MVPFIPLDAADDPWLDDYRNVPDADLLHRRGLFVAEGRLVVARLLDQPGIAVRSVLVSAAARDAMASVWDARPDVPVFVVPVAVVQAITGFNLHRGCLALAERPAPRPWEVVAADARRLVVLERVANADNVGGVFRNAAAFAAGGVLLDEACTDPLYRKAIRTSVGTALQVPFARLTPWPGALAALRAAGWTLVALTPAGGVTIADVATRYASSRLALVFGHEGDGLSTAAMAGCDVAARIPMAAGVDSLNVATACAIALYECS